MLPKTPLTLVIVAKRCDLLMEDIMALKLWMKQMNKANHKVDLELEKILEKHEKDIDLLKNATHRPSNRSN